MTLHPNTRILTGERFGRLLVIAPFDRDKGGNVVWACQCDCGKQVNVRGMSLKPNKTSSCGCLCRENVSRSKTTHGLSKTPEYKAWIGMKARCINVDDENYHRYGGRGISVCDRWLEAFDNFYADVGPRPSKLHSLDRRDNDGNYEADNCRWVVQTTQSRNRRSSVLSPEALRLLHSDFQKGGTISDISRKAGVNCRTVRDALNGKTWIGAIDGLST